MRLTPFRPFRSIHSAHSTHSTTRPLTRRLLVRLRGTFSRKLICLAVMLSLVMLPAPGLAYEGRLFSSVTVDVTAGSVRVVSWLFNMIFGAQATPPETLADRVAQVRVIRMSPSRYVFYPGESLTFQAIGQNFAGQTVQGVVFDDWTSSNPASVQVDDSGHARSISPGLSTITCRVGAAVAIARVLVRPGGRPRQTDAEWKADQDSFIADGRPTTDDGRLGMVTSALSSMLENLAPTAYAQGGGYSAPDFGYDELWSESRNLVGSPRNRAIEPTGLGPVLPEGSNFNFSVPLIGLGGRGIGANLTLNYNSRVWSRHGNAVTFSAAGGFPFAGFSIGFGRILTYGPTASTTYVLIQPDGTRHLLGTGNAGVNTTYTTSDGSHITFVSSTAWGTTTIGGTLYYNDGTQVSVSLFNNRLLAEQIKDTNGNFVSLGYTNSVASPLAINAAADSQGRLYQFNYNGSGDLISITAPGYGGTAQNPITRTVAQFDYQSRTVSYNFGGLTVENAPTGAVNVLRHVYFPATGTGSLFTYSDYGMVYNVSSRRQMTIDGNGVISDGVESASVAFNYPTSGSTSLTDAPAFTQRTETPTGGPSGVFNYLTTPGFQTTTYNVTRPDSSTLLLTRSTDGSSIANGLLTQTEIKNSAGGSMSKAIIAYANDPGGSVQPQSVTGYDDTNTPAKVDFDYDTYGDVTNKRDYGFQIGGVWQVRRRTSFTYSTDTNYTSRYLRNLMTEATVYDALQNTNDADDVLIAKTANTFDDYASTGGMEGYGLAKPPGHDTAVYSTSFTYRGNVTGTTQWIDIAANTTLPTRLKKYDKFGNILQEQVSCCKQKVFTYVANDYWANPPTVTDGDPQTLHLTGATTYDFNTGLPKYTEFANMGKRWFFYDAALRLIQQDLPTGGSETASYNDANMTASFTKPGLGTNTLTYDGFGRVIQAVDANNGQVNTSYDAMGRVASRTNPFTAGGTPGPSSGFTYDALGRVTIVTLPDSQTIQTSYSGTTVTATDQVNRKIKREMDGLGRLVKVTEQDATGALTQETSYSYNLFDKITLVNQGNQTRSFSYDALGRLLYERIPEQTATINDGTGTYWTTKYTYTDFSALATRTDARGVIATYSYDTMNRLTTINYNTSYAPGVATTPSISYSYDNTNGSPTNGLMLTTYVIDGNTIAYQESYGYDSVKQLSSVTRTIDSINYTTSYQGAAGLRSQITYPSGRVVNINRSSTGRLNSLTDGAGANYLNGIGYNAAGQVTGLTLGNGVAETYGYDSNRLQLTTQTATKSGGPQNGLMNLTYNYQASAGQMGGGTTTGNAGQLMSISGTINATTESAGYTYDNLGRLVTSNQTSNGSSAQRRFGYDRWGNRTGMWDATSGGNQIQTIVLQQSGGAPTNQLQSVTTSGVSKNYTYDAAGNVTNDGTHTYQYDAENRIVSVDAAVTAIYSYDHNNRRIKTVVGSTTTHFVWEGSQVIAEHDGAAGSVIVDYLYSGARMIATVVNGVSRYVVGDRLSARLLLDTSGNVLGRQGHLPFGEDFGETGTQEKHHLTSYERDAGSSIDYALNRWSAPGIGRFLQADRYRPSQHRVTPQSWNRYAYAENEPIDRTDRAGRDWEPSTNPENQGCFWDSDTNTLWCPLAPLGGSSSATGSSSDQISIEGSSLNSNPIAGGQVLPQYDEARRKCDQTLASMFGGSGAVAAGNEFEPNGNYRGTLNGRPGHLTNMMHIYGSADGTQDTTVYVPANYDKVTVLGPGGLAFHYKELGNLKDVLLVIFHVANYNLGPVVGGRRSIGQTGGPGNEDSTNYRHAHFELFPGDHYPETEAERKGLRIPFSQTFCN
jgi:RHS repeat-associated protein